MTVCIQINAVTTCAIMIIQQHCVISTLQYSGVVLYTHFSHYLYEVKVGYRIYTVVIHFYHQSWACHLSRSGEVQHWISYLLLLWSTWSWWNSLGQMDSKFKETIRRYWYSYISHSAAPFEGLRSFIYHSRSRYGACIVMFSYCKYLLQTHHAHAVENLALLYMRLTSECYSSLSDKG